MGAVGTMLNAGNEHRVKQTQVEEDRKAQVSKNQVSAQMTSLQAKVQSISNQAKMDAGAAQQAALTNRMIVASEGFTTGTFQDRLNAASQMGAATAGAAAAGVGGSTVDSFNRTLSLTRSIQEEANKRNFDRGQFNANQTRIDIMQNSVNSLDNNSYFANLDHTIYLDHVKQGGQWGSLIATAVATYFGGPMAGAQAAQTTGEISRAGYMAQNGQYEQSNAQLTSALGGGMQLGSMFSGGGGGQAAGGQAAGGAMGQAGSYGGQYGFGNVNIS